MPFKLYPLARLLGPYLTYEQAHAMHNDGRISQRQWQWFVTLWVWSTIRWSDLERANQKQDRTYAALGMQGVYRRIDRVNKLREKLWQHHFADYLVPDAAYAEQGNAAASQAA